MWKYADIFQTKNITEDFFLLILKKKGIYIVQFELKNITFVFLISTERILLQHFLFGKYLTNFA